MTTWPQISIDPELGYSHCFGCGPDNPIGLKLSFQRDGDKVRGEFTPSELYQGWPDLVHGGIILCLLDEAMSYAVIFEGAHGVTARIQAKLGHTASINEPLIITASVTKKTRKLIESTATVSLKDGTLIAEGKATHFVAQSPDTRNKPITKE